MRVSERTTTAMAENTEYRMPMEKGAKNTTNSLPPCGGKAR
jgi:hypothetical protein